MTPGLRAYPAVHLAGDETGTREEWVVEETPIALLYNGLPFAVMMATPADLEDFALGFAVCERIVERADEFALVDIVRNERGIVLHGAIPQARFDGLDARARGLEGRSGCGLCGISQLEAALRPARPVGAGPRLAPTRVHAALTTLAERQPLNAQSGGAHAAGFAHAAGVLVREDVGRHNAVDKLVGALLRATPAIDPDDGFLAITSRASYEIVHKAANAGIAAVAAMSAPTGLAIRHAEDAGMTLIAFARGGRMNVYSGRERIASG
ncbi:MAG: formate dehydrogenase accessory sulfurtransferase FdhD [Pseudomonadota bacterium]